MHADVPMCVLTHVRHMFEVAVAHTKIRIFAQCCEPVPANSDEHFQHIACLAVVGWD
jgi:hypothetical protein